MYETGRPTFELSSIGLFVIGREDEAPLYGLRSYLTVDVGNLRGGDDCAKQAIEGESYSFLEPLLFIVTITVKAGSLVISGSMSGVWTKYVANVELLRCALARVLYSALTSGAFSGPLVWNHFISQGCNWRQSLLA